jgi:serine protease inhibitor
MKTKILVSSLILAAAPTMAAEPKTVAAQPTAAAAEAINELGIDLLRHAGKPDGNFLVSPYSVQEALAMTCNGAAGGTREEMVRVLHFPADDKNLNRSFAELRQALNQVMENSAKNVQREGQHGMTNDPVVITVANRLFGQSDYDFRVPFLAITKDSYGAPLEPVDFAKDAAGATKQINTWVEQQTRERIRNLIPDGGLTDRTRLVLVNAIYLKAPWANKFTAAVTRPRPFHIGGGKTVEVLTMEDKQYMGYFKGEGFTAVGIPYRGGELQFLILLPDHTNGLPALEKRLTSGWLAGFANLPGKEGILSLPKFKLEPPMLPLGGALRNLGMKSAFTPGANFDRMAPARNGQSLYISEVFHKTFLELDEEGTEAAAATAVAMIPTSIAHEKPKPIEVNVDHPFVFAIQHRASGACLFLGHVTDPR